MAAETNETQKTKACGDEPNCNNYKIYCEEDCDAQQQACWTSKGCGDDAWCKIESNCSENHNECFGKCDTIAHKGPHKNGFCWGKEDGDDDVPSTCEAIGTALAAEESDNTLFWAQWENDYVPEGVCETVTSSNNTCTLAYRKEEDKYNKVELTFSDCNEAAANSDDTPTTWTSCRAGLKHEAMSATFRPSEHEIPRP